MDEGGLTDMQVEVSRMFFDLRASAGYVVAGGAALLASDLISRGTQDLDLFAALPVTAVTSAKEQLVEAVTVRGWVVELIHDSPAFCRLVISGEDVVLVDLALDSPPRSVPAVTILGPTLAPLELAGRKLLALFGRAEARDFADVYVLSKRFGKESLLAEAATADQGFDPAVLGQMMATFDRFDDDAVPLEAGDVAAARAFFDHWVEELADAG